MYSVNNPKNEKSRDEYIQFKNKVKQLKIQARKVIYFQLANNTFAIKLNTIDWELAGNGLPLGEGWDLVVYHFKYRII